MAFREKYTRFPYLDVVRYAVAAVVCVCVLVLVAMVFAVVLRPENIRISILHGHVEADALWTRKVTEIPGASGVDAGDQDVLPLPPARARAGGRQKTVVKYNPAESVNLRVSFRAGNPSGRADIRCDNVTIRVLDVPNAPTNSFEGMVELGKFNLEEPLTLMKQRSRTIKKWLAVHDKNVLAYIARTYGSKGSFQAMVEINATISSDLTAGRFRGKTFSYCCWPVVVGLDMPSATAKAVTCMLCEDINNPTAFAGPAPAPPVGAAA